VLFSGWDWVFKTLEGPGNVARHGQITGASFVVPVERDATVERTGPVHTDCVMLFQDTKEMLGMLFANIFDPKVINSEAEHDGTGGVSEHCWGVLQLVIAFVEKDGDQFVIGKATSLGEAVHSTGDFGPDMVVVHKGP
jgi:hypothetical protein